VIKAIIIAGSEEKYRKAIQTLGLSEFEYIFIDRMSRLDEIPKPVEVFYCGDWWRNPIMQELSVRQVNEICAAK